MIVGNVAYHNSGRVRRYLEENDDFVRLIFLPPYSPFLNPAEWPWRSGKTKIWRIFRRPAKSCFKRKIMSVYKSLEIKFELRNIMFRDLDNLLTL